MLRNKITIIFVLIAVLGLSLTIAYKYFVAQNTENSNLKGYKDIEMANPEFSGFDKEGKLYTVKAIKTKINPSLEHVLSSVDATYYIDSGRQDQFIHILSGSGLFNLEKRHILFTNAVNVNLSDVYTFATEGLDVDLKTMVATSTNEAILKSSGSNMVAKQGLSHDMKGKIVEFKGGVDTIIMDSKSSELNIKSTEAKVDYQYGVAEYMKDVAVTKNNMLLNCDKLSIIYDLNGSNSKLKTLDFVGNVKITQNDTVATGDSGVYIQDTETVILTGNATLSNKSGVMKGQEIVYNTKLETFKMAGTQAPTVEGESKRVKVVVQQ